MSFIGRVIWLLFSLVAIIAAMIFATSNTHMAELYFWPLDGRLSISLWILVLGALVAGAIFGGGLVWISLIAARTRNWRLERRLGKAEKRASVAEDKLTEANSDRDSPSMALTGGSIAPIARLPSDR